MSKIYQMEVPEGAKFIDLVVDGETSDGYHTFNELYDHRMILSAYLLNLFEHHYPGSAFKSRKHSDGSMYDDMFIVGLETSDGWVTYHYNLGENEENWTLFNVPEVAQAPEWDGSTPNDCLERLRKGILEDIEDNFGEC